MDIVISIGAKMAEYTIRPIIHQFGYLIHYDSNIKDLNEKVENLRELKEELQNEVEEVERNAEEIKVNVKAWLNIADEIIGEYKKFQEHDGEIEKRCFNQSCLKLVQRHQLSRRAKKLTKHVLRIKEDGKFEIVSHRRDPQQFIKNLIDAEGNYVNFKSRDSTMENIMMALEDSNIDMIGIFGMGGVGKTELVKEILKHVKETKLFHIVVMTTISHDPNVRKIQGEIGDMLGLRFEEESIVGRASKLLMRLQDEKNEKGTLIVLDDIWKFLDLKTVGIPYKGCKILLTSRDKDVLFNEMHVKMNFELKALNNEESWNFFKKVIDETIEENSSLELIAHQVVNECSGLPIALVTVAKALTGKSLAIWQDALEQLKSSNVESIKGMNEKVYSSLQLSYNFLENNETKNIFLFCSMYPEDYDIGVEDDLLRYVVGMRLLASHNTMTKARNRLIKLKDDLKSSSLLLESDEEEGNYVKMHDVIRDFARSFISKHEEMSIIRDNNVNFTHCDDFDNLSRTLKFSELELLVLTSNDEDRDFQIPQAFFNGMDRIKVLEFKGGGISILPSSLCSLTNLRTLSLLGCTDLKNIDLINDLKGLEILSFRCSSIKELPSFISPQLKMLDLSDCKELVISANIISRLTNLEELDLRNSFSEWEREVSNSKKEKASLSELKSLPYLAALRTWIPDAKILSEQMFSKGSKLERFEIIIGSKLGRFEKEKLVDTEKTCSKVLTLNLNSRIVINNDLKKLVNNAEKMVLRGLISENGVFSVYDEFHLSPQLKHLRIYDNSNIDYIMSEDEPHLFQVSATLESLHLHTMRNLESVVCSDIILKGVCFTKLRIIVVKNCHKMKSLFVFSFIKCLPNLQSIEVEYCLMMESIVAMENQNNKLQLHQLKSLTLRKLPQCTRFCLEVNQRRHLLFCDSERLEIMEECDISNNFRPFFNEQDQYVNMEELILSEIDNLKMIWHHKLTIHSFGKLKHIDIKDCQNLSKVFSSHVIKAFQALEKVVLWNCGSLKEIFEINNNLGMVPTEEQYDDDNMIKIPLRYLHLRNLSNLKHVWSEDPHKISLIFQTLRDIEIHKCQKLKSVFPVSFTKCSFLRQLECLRIIDCAVEKIFGEDNKNELQHKATLPNVDTLMIEKADNLKTNSHDELIVDPFSNLQRINIIRCKNLRKIFSSNTMGAFRVLKKVKVRECELLEEIFKIDELAKEKEIRSDVLDAQLEILELSDLPKLNHVWSIDPGEFSVFQKLRRVKVLKCPEIRTVFPASFAKYLPRQLKNLEIECSGLEEIFENEADTLGNESVFHKVSFSNLKELKLECHEMAMIRFFEHIRCPRLIILKLIAPRFDSPEFDQVMPKLENSKIENMFLKDIFSENRKSATTLEELHLKNLPKLIHIWKAYSGMSTNLKIIEVEGCIGINVILPSPLTFQNLLTLKVNRCHGLTNLLPFSVAKSLVQLETMHVQDCKKMTSIIGEEEEEEETEIVFSKLSWLKLYSLPRVEAFHLGKCNIKFPFLYSIEISQCLKMKTFSLGMRISTPLLEVIEMSIYQHSLDGNSISVERLSVDSDINSTIRKYWERR